MTNLDEVEPEDEDRAYRSKGYFARVAVAARGPGGALRDRARTDVSRLLFAAGDLSHGARSSRHSTRVDRGQGRGGTSGRPAGVDQRDEGHRLVTGGRVDPAPRGRPWLTFVVDRHGTNLTKRVELTQQVLDGQTGWLPASSQRVVVPRPRLLRGGRVDPRRVGTVAHESIDALGQIFSPSGITKYVHVLAGTDKNRSDRASGSCRPSGSRTSRPTRSTSGWIAVVTLLARAERVLGLVNLLPLLPVRRRSHRDRDLREDRVAHHAAARCRSTRPS